jgi:hypothetical protein
MSRRIPANQIDLRAGNVVYGRDGLRGVVDHLKKDRRHASVSWDDGSGHDRISIDKLTVDRPAPPRPQPRWAEDLQELAERQVQLPAMRRFQHQRLAGALLLWILVASVTQNVVVVIALTCMFCFLPMARRRG